MDETHRPKKYSTLTKIFYFCSLAVLVYFLFNLETFPLAFFLLILISVIYIVGIDGRYLIGGGIIVAIFAILRTPSDDVSRSIGVTAFCLLATGILALVISYFFRRREDFRRRSNTLVALIACASIAFAALSSVLLGEGIISIGDFAFPFNAYDFESSSFLSLWKQYDSYNGISTIIQTLFILPFAASMNFLKLTITQCLQTMLFVTFTGSLLATYFFTKFLASKFVRRQHVLIEIGALLAATFYIFNPWSLSHLSQFYLWLGYAFLPLVVLLFLKALDGRDLRRALPYVIATALATTVLSFTSPHFIVYTAGIFAVVLIVFLLFARGRQRPRYLITFLLLIALLLVFNLYWILPNIDHWQVNSSLAAPDYLLLVDDVGNEISTPSAILNLLALRGVGAELSNFLRVVFLIFPALILASLIINRRRGLRISLIAILIGITSLLPAIFMVLSPAVTTNAILNFPLINSISWVFLRVVDRSAGILALTYLLAIIFPFVYLVKYQTGKQQNMGRAIKRPKLVYPVCILISVLVGLAIFLPLSHHEVPTPEKLYDKVEKLTLTNAEQELIRFRPLPLPAEYLDITKELHLKNTTAKVTWLPITMRAEAYTWSRKNYLGDIFTRSSGLPAISSSSPYAKYYFAYLQDLNYTDPTYDKFYDVLGVEYLPFRTDIVDLGPKELMRQRDEVAQKSTGLAIAKSGENVSLFTNSGPADYVQLATKSVMAVGGYDSLPPLFNLADSNSKATSVLFVDQDPPGSNLPQFLKGTDLILWNNTNLDDLVMTGIDPGRFVDLATQVPSDDPINGWDVASTSNSSAWPRITKDRLSLANWDFDYGRGLVYFTVEDDDDQIQLVKKFELDRDDEYVVLARVLENSHGGKLNFQIPVEYDCPLTEDQKSYKFSVNTQYNQNRFRWVALGTQKLPAGEHRIHIENENGFNAVNLIAFVPQDEYKSDQEQIAKIVEEKDNIMLFDQNNSFRDEYPVVADQEYQVRQLDHLGNTLPQTVCQDISPEVCRAVEDSPKESDNETPNLVHKDQLIVHDPGSVTKKGDATFELNQSLLEKNRRVISAPIQIEPKTEYYLIITIDTENVTELSSVIRQQSDEEKTVATEKVFQGLQGDLRNKIFVKRVTTRDDTRFLKLEIGAGRPAGPASFTVKDISLLTRSQFKLLPATTELVPKDLSWQNDSEVPKIEFDKISPTKTHVTVTAAQKPFTISFAESFDPGWKLSLSSENYYHFPAFGTTNGYQIKQTGDFEFDVYFTGQKWFTLGLKISTGAIIVALLIMIFWIWRNYKLARR
ncbi:hypothetical protein ACFL0Z_01265 [Patescibacteria group bacterium]